MMDLAEFISHLSSATVEEGYSWRLHRNPKDTYKNGIRQLALLATLANRDDFSVVEVVTRRLYENIKRPYPIQKVNSSLMGNSRQADEVFEDIGVSLPILYIVEGCSLTFDRGRSLTPIHEMLAKATNIKIKFDSPWGGEWASSATWSQIAYNYEDLLSDRQTNMTEDEQRRIEGLAIEMMGRSRIMALNWLENSKECEGRSIWNAIKLQGLKEMEKYICYADQYERTE